MPSFAEDLTDLRANIARLDDFMNGAAGAVVQLKTAQIATLLGLIGSSAGTSAPTLTWPGRHWIDTTVPASPVLYVRDAADTAWIELAVIPEVANPLTEAAADLLYASLSANNTLGGAQNIAADSPILSLYENLAALDEKRWDIRVIGGNISIRSYNDAGVFLSSDYEILRDALGALKHVFRTGNADAAVIEPAGTAAPAAETVITREKGDARYHRPEDFTVSLGANGYKVHPDGLILQWGSFTATANSNTATTFPVAFTTLHSVTLGPWRHLVGAQDNPAALSAVSATGFTVRNEADNTGTCYWMAIGE